MSVFVCVGFMFGNLSALAMEPLGHVAGAGAAVVSSLSTLIALPLGILVGQRFDGTMYPFIGAFAIFGAATYAANVWARAQAGVPDRRRRTLWVAHRRGVLGLRAAERIVQRSGSPLAAGPERE